MPVILAAWKAEIGWRNYPNSIISFRGYKQREYFVTPPVEPALLYNPNQTKALQDHYCLCIHMQKSPTKN
jgi:hypothetical protein